MQKEMVEADVLCVGGGIAGLMAAIRASELGAKVVIAEKGNVLRSGAGAMGNDHFWCYIPEVHGSDIRPIIERAQHSQQPGMGGTNFLRTWYENSFDMVKLWDSWGISMKYNGKYEFAGHGYAGGPPLMSLKYAGRDQKKILIEQALKRGVQIINRVMVIDLLHYCGVSGAIGIHTREDKVVEFQAKSVVIGTGRMVRLYPGPTPAWMSNLMTPFNLTGDGRAMAYRAGAELVNMERFARHAGPKYLCRGGQGTWVGVLRDPNGKPIGPFVSKPDRRYGDYMIEANKTLFRDHLQLGKGPVYMDCRGISEKDYEYMLYWFEHEGDISLLDHLKDEGIDLRRNPIEFMTYDVFPLGGVAYNDKSETSVKGLYAAGDESRGGISCAAVFGWIAGENAAKYAKGAGLNGTAGTKADVDEKKTLLILFSVHDGTNPGPVC